MKKNVMMRMVMAIVIVFGVQATASAQLGGLLKRGKKIVKENIETTTNEVRTEVAEPAATTPAVTSVTEPVEPKKKIHNWVDASYYKKAKHVDWDYSSSMRDVVNDMAYWCKRLRTSAETGDKSV